MNSQHYKKSGAGFTLIELLLYVIIISILLFVTSMFFGTLLEGRVKHQVVGEVEQQGVQVMHVITQSIRNSVGINSPATSTSGTILSLAMATSTLNPTIFDSFSGIVRIKEGVSSTIQLVSSRVSVTNLLFENLSRPGTSGIIRVSFTLTHNNPGGRNEYEYSKTFFGSATLR